MTQTIDSIRWRTTLESALQEASQSGKFVLLDFFNPG